MSGEGRTFLCLGAVVLLVGTALGAYGTHGVRGSVDAGAWLAYEAAVDYQIFHGLGLLAVGLVAERYPRLRLVGIAGWLLLGGVVLFSGSLYATTFGAPGPVGRAAPFGGACFILGWACLAWAALKVGPQGGPGPDRGENI